MTRLISAILVLCLAIALTGCATAADPSTSPSALASSMPPSSAPSNDRGASAPMASGPTRSMAESGETVTIDIANFAFEPSSVTIRPGTEVIFTNSDAAPHTVTAGTDAEPQPDVFDSGLLQPGDTFTFVFDEAGTYGYFCERHPPMTGSIVVEG